MGLLGNGAEACLLFDENNGRKAMPFSRPFFLPTGKHPKTLITEAIYQKTLIPGPGMLLFPFGFVPFELFDILCRGLELRNFVRCRRPRADFIQPGIGIVFKFQQESKTAEFGMILTDELQVGPAAGIRLFQGPGKITGKMLTAEIEKRRAVKIFINLLKYTFRQL
jgi:hypothetical protein